MPSLGVCPACDAPGATFHTGGSDERIECPRCGELFIAYEAELDDARALVAAGDPSRAVAEAHRMLERALAGAGPDDRPIYDRLVQHLGEWATADMRFKVAGTARVLERFARPMGSAEATAQEARLVIDIVEHILAPR